MKRKIIVVLLIILLMTTVMFGGCKKQEPVEVESPVDWKTFDMTTGVIQEGLKSTDLFLEGVANFENEEYFERKSLLDGGAVKPIKATQVIYDIYKRTGTQYFHQKTAYGPSAAAETYEGKRYYFDGTNGYEYKNDEFTKNYKSGSEILTPDFSNATYSAFSGDTAKENAGIKNFSDYTFETFAPDNDNKVYKIDDYYYINISVDCIADGQAAVSESICNTLNCTDFVWKSNSSFKCQLKKDGEKYFITSCILAENYEGQKKVLGTNLTVEVNQTVISNFKYGQDKVSILDTEKKK